MPTNVYLRMAAANLRQAATAKTAEIDELRRQIDNTQRETAQKVEQTHAEIQRREAENGKPGIDGIRRADNLREVGRLQAEISKLQNDANTKISAMQNDIRAKQREAQNFLSQ